MNEMRGILLIKTYAGGAALLGFCIVDLVFCGASMGVALLISALLDTAATALSSGDFSPVVRMTIVACLYALVLGGLMLAAGALKTRIVRVSMVRIREDAAQGLMAGSGTPCANSSEQLTVLGQNMETLEGDCVSGSIDMMESIFKIAIGCVALVLINPLIAIVSLVGMAVPSLIPQLFARHLSDQQQRIVSSAARYNGRVRDMAQGAEVIRSFRVVGSVLGKVDAEAERYQGDKASLGMTMVCVSGMASIAGVIMQLAIMGLTGVFAVLGLVTIGSIVAVTQLSGSVISPAVDLSGKLGKLRSTYPILDVLDELAAHAREATAPVPRKVSRSLELDGVSFSYDGRDGHGAADVSAPASAPKLLDECSARFEAGGKYAIVGKSGSGKSTVLGLLGGRLSPSEGRVLVDGRADAAPDAAWVHQSVFLFDDTLCENITLGQPFTDEQVGRAVRLAGLGDVVTALPDGLDTQVEEGGSRFSGGERQRIAIARALLFGKTTLLVDEATSALDRRMAARIEDTLLSLAGVTLVVVTHHLDERHAARYDKVFELSGGKLTDIAVNMPPFSS